MPSHKTQSKNLLLLDMGNTRVKWALSVAGELCEFGATETAEFTLQHCLRGMEGIQIDGIVCCCVAAQSMIDSLNDDALELLKLTPIIAIVESERGGVLNQYKNLSQLGVDRWIAMLGAARANLDNQVIVVDAGTAVTIDLLSAKREFVGGVIFPGAELLSQSLNQHTARISAERTSTNTVFGTSTDECVSAGVRFGSASAVKGIIEQMLIESPTHTDVLLCGGGAQALVELMQGFEHSLVDSIKVDKDLIFKGLIALSQ
ncbi:MAG: type III pantothenate kinase [Pseudomonadota bacterium]